MDSNVLRKILKAQRDLYLRSEDNVLVVLSESFADAPIADILKNHKHHIHQIPDVSYPGEDYNLPMNLLRDTTVGWLITNLSINHSVATRNMIEESIFLISNPGITPDWISVLNPSNVSVCQKNTDLLEKRIGGNLGGTVRILANDGTDLFLKVPFMNWIKEVGKRTGIGTNGLYGEFMTSPYTANGFYVLNPGDFLTNPINEAREMIDLTIRNNHIVKIEGCTQAKAFRQMLEKTENPKAFNLAEFAIGINPGRPRETFRSVVAEKLIGGVHIATGTNSVCLHEVCPELHKFQYGRYNCGIHIDCIKFGSSVLFKADKQEEWVTLLIKGKMI